MSDIKVDLLEELLKKSGKVAGKNADAFASAARNSGFLGGIKHEAGRQVAKGTGKVAKTGVKVGAYGGAAVGANYMLGNPVGEFHKAATDLGQKLKESTDSPVMGFVGDNLGAIGVAMAGLVGWGVASRVPFVGSALSTPFMVLALGATAYTAWNAWSAYSEFNRVADNQGSQNDPTLGQQLNTPLNTFSTQPSQSTFTPTLGAPS